MAAQPKRRDIVNLTGGVNTEDGRLLYGMDAEVYLKAPLPTSTSTPPLIASPR